MRIAELSICESKFVKACQVGTGTYLDTQLRFIYHLLVISSHVQYLMYKFNPIERFVFVMFLY
jgi:hypothetical protein